MNKCYFENKLSIILCVYNEESNIEKILNTLKNQIYKNIEIILVDNKSNDKTLEKAEYWFMQNGDIEYKIIKQKNNEGLLKSRIKGLGSISGDFFCFIDADDSITIDLYRKMMKRACETNSEIVMSQIIRIDNCNNCYIYNSPPFDSNEIYWKDNTEVVENYLNLSYWNLDLIHVWNKIYSKNILERISTYIKKIELNLTLYEDWILSLLFFINSNSVSSIQNDYYKYYVKENSCRSKNGNVKEEVEQMFNAFIEIKKIMINWKLFKKYSNIYFTSLKYNFDVWINELNNKSEFNEISKLKKHKDYKNNIKLDYNLFNLYYSNKIFVSDELDKIKRKIRSEDIEVVSFDVFDTLLLRPFIDPYDMFNIVSKDITKIIGTTDVIDFYKIRSNSEKKARLISKKGDVTIDEIYCTMKQEYPFLENKINDIKKIEIQSEFKYCYKRKIGKELYEFAKFCGKKIIYISDMYLSSKTIAKILNKNELYEKSNEIFVSSEYGCLKSSGRLFQKILKKIKIKPKNMIHIGDNYFSDVEQPSRIQINTFHLPRTIDLFLEKIYKPVLNEHNKYENNILLKNWSLRNVLAIIANIMYDNPFIEIKNDAKTFGTLFLGSYVIGCFAWLLDEYKNGPFEKITFLARDGFLFKKCFDIFNQLSNINIKTEYLRISRKSFIPFTINDEKDLMNLPFKFPKIFEWKIQYVLEIFQNYFIKNDVYEIANEIYKKTKLKINDKIGNTNNWNKISILLYNDFFDKSTMIEYNKNFKNLLSKIFDCKTMLFDSSGSLWMNYELKNIFSFSSFSITSHEHCENRKYIGKIDFRTLYSEIPKIPSANPIKEIFISECSPSCIRWDFSKDGSVTYIYESDENTFIRNFIIKNFQEYALSLFKEYLEKFLDYDNGIFVSEKKYLCEVFDKFLLNVDIKKNFLSILNDSDSLSNFINFNLSSYTDNLISCDDELNNCSRFHNLNKYRKAVVLLFYDFSLFKKAVYEKYKNRRLIIKTLMFLNSLIFPNKKNN